MITFSTCQLPLSPLLLLERSQAGTDNVTDQRLGTVLVFRISVCPTPRQTKMRQNKTSIKSIIHP